MNNRVLPTLPDQLYAYGFSWRKRRILRRFAAPARVSFVGRLQAVPAGACLLLWGSRAAAAPLAPNVTLVRVEDGFLRSVGLGADLVQPLSWVFDQHGIYYDATRPSDLEILLGRAQFPIALLERAAALRERIVASRLTKYNVGSAQWRRPEGVGQVILVPGQVESDASLRFGAPDIAGNLALLQAVRLAKPDAYIVYKPHPDVAAGLRAPGTGESQAELWCDEIVRDVAMDTMFANVDEVHVLTSLAGFEALLRGIPVVCYGIPFYAGWGLTEDRLPVSRRTRTLSLDALVAGALILYPRYTARNAAGGPVSPEQVLDELAAWRADAACVRPWWQAGWRRLLRLIGG
jgi:capsular polysaccharide export protein